MLDINLIRKDPEGVKEALSRKGFQVDFSAFLEEDRRRREMIQATETLKAERNRASSQIPQIRKAGGDVAAIMSSMKEVADRIKGIDEELALLEQSQKAFLDSLPNLPADGVPAGGKESNQVVDTFGEKPVFAFAPRHHVDIVETLGIIDYARGVKLGGNGYWLYRGDGARLEWALLSYFMDEHMKDGYEMILPPHILTYACGYTAGQFPKFSDDVFQIRDEDTERGFTHFLLPTSETALVNLYREIGRASWRERV